MLHNYSFLPRFINYNSHFLSKQIFPSYFAIIAIIIGILLVSIGMLVRKPSGGFGPDVESYFYLLYPEKGKLITEGMDDKTQIERELYKGMVFIQGLYGFDRESGLPPKDRLQNILNQYNQSKTK